MTPDSELLHRYATQADEAAFAELVRRQVNLVYGVALRVTGGNATLAEEVTQNVFTDLARKAGPLSRHEALAGWLHTSARYAALMALRGEQRRRKHEQEASAMQDPSIAPEVDWEQLRPALDEAVGRLREKDRAAVVLRFFQGLSHREVGEALGTNENAARKRVDHALEKLRGHFARAGITVSSALLAATLTTHGAGNAPVSLAGKIAPPPLPGCSAVGSSVLASLIFRISLMSTKIKTILTVATLAALIIFIPLGFWLRNRPDSTQDKTKTAPAKSPAKAVEKPTAPTAPAAGSPPPADARTEEAKYELHLVIADIIDKLENDPTSALMSHMPGFRSPPTDLNTMNLSPSEAAKVRQQRADANAKLKSSLASQQLTVEFKAMLDATPALNADGTAATYTFDDATVAQIAALRNGNQYFGHTFQFIKVNGQWFIDPGE